LLVGGHDADGVLRFAGRVGTGFSDTLLVSLRKRLDGLARTTPPFVDAPTGRAAAGMHWVQPEIVIQAGYVDWTYDRLLRHPRFLGFREDVDPRTVRLPISDSERERDAPSDPPADRRRAARPGRVSAAPDGPTVVEGITITNPDKVLYPESGIRKIELVRYYETVAEHMLPFVSDRPLTLVRCPEGITNCFYQKHIEGTVPDAIRKIPIREGDEVSEYASVTSAAGLVALAQLGVLEIHAGGSRRNDLERPDRFTIDLDPDPDVPWLRVVEAVLDVRGFLGELGFDSFLKTTGGKGLHVVVAITPERGWDEVKEFTRSVAQAIASEQPNRYTLSISKEKRRGRILLDYLRNGRGATAIEAWSTRARPGAPVALPVRWEELAEGLQSDRYTLRNVPERLASLREDPWLDYEESRRRITRAMLRRVGMP
jgi:bifunctional non-homologous end joining protein LigD